MHSLLALVHWYAGREDEARRACATSPPIDELPGFLLLAAATGLVELAESFEDRPMPEAAYRRLAPYADLFCCGGAGVIATTGSVHGPLGVAAAALGRIDEGVRHLRRAIDVNERVGARGVVAVTGTTALATQAAGASPSSDSPPGPRSPPGSPVPSPVVDSDRLMVCAAVAKKAAVHHAAHTVEADRRLRDEI